jgi:hypothetical protein
LCEGSGQIKVQDEFFCCRDCVSVSSAAGFCGDVFLHHGLLQGDSRKILRQFNWFSLIFVFVLQSTVGLMEILGVLNPDQVFFKVKWVSERLSWLLEVFDQP